MDLGHRVVHVVKHLLRLTDEHRAYKDAREDGANVVLRLEHVLGFVGGDGGDGVAHDGVNAQQHVVHHAVESRVRFHRLHCFSPLDPSLTVDRESLVQNRVHLMGHAAQRAA